VLRADDATSLPLLYHLNSEPWLNFEAYTEVPQEQPWHPACRARELARSEADTELVRLLRRRSSCRSFARQPMPLSLLARLLENGCGCFGLRDLSGGLLSYARPSPSAGALYPIEVYLVTKQVEDLPDSMYHYLPDTHSLEPVSGAPPLPELSSLLLSQQFLADATAIVFLAADFRRTLRKYGPRGYRYILLEAGHTAQSFCILATEAGLGSLCLGGFFDAQLNHRLGLDGRDQAVVYGVAFGYPRQ
jgi:SagB-type dehydrogenase family enzyme